MATKDEAPRPFTVTAPPDLNADHAEALRLENWRTETDALAEGKEEELEAERAAAEVTSERVEAGQAVVAHAEADAVWFERVHRPLEYSDDETPELTGEEGSAEEAAMGDAGNGGSIYGGDFTGVRPRPLLEEDPAEPADILPDSIEAPPEAAPEDQKDEDELTARPSSPKPMDPSHWP